MPRRIERSDDSRADLRAIFAHIAKDNRPAALRFVARIDKLMTTLATSPAIGRLRPNLRRDMRSLALGHYIAFYEFDDESVRLLRVLHGARDIGPKMFDRDED